ncbi:MAG: L,D-transpeptidase family protein [Geminicoccaceae bacterium]|nr:L,D-transpeptidase family protein [Geminicoccaceae bacterium]
MSFRPRSTIVAVFAAWVVVASSAAGALARSVQTDRGPRPEPVTLEAGDASEAEDAPKALANERERWRRAVILALLAREARLDPSVRFDRALLEDGRRARDAELAFARAWHGYLLRRQGGGGTIDPTRVRAVSAFLDGAPIGDPLALAVLELRIVEALGGWQPVPAQLEEEPFVPAEGVQPAAQSGSLRRRWVVDRTRLVRRLVQSLDLPARFLSDPVPENLLRRAVERFQRRHGLSADGVVGSRTLAALNEPIGEQIRRAALNLARREGSAARSALRRYVEVNIPAFELRLIENGHVTLRSRVIVGDDKTPTPVFDDVIRYIDLNPSWYVPPGIVKELLEKAKQEPGYFERAGFTWQTSENGRTRLVQRPGPENALGRFKFVFPNHHAVYLHDTAQRGLFGRADQALSHGCIRLDRPRELALALLAEQGWTAERLQQVLDSGRTRRIELAEPVPVFLDYRTVDLDGEGRLLLFADLYGHDRAGRATFEGKRPLDARAEASAGRIRASGTSAGIEGASATVLD